MSDKMHDEQTGECYFEVTLYSTTLHWLPHGVECVAKVCYRLSPDEPRRSHTRIISSIAANEGLAEYWVQKQVAAWERGMRAKYAPPAPASTWLP